MIPAGAVTDPVDPFRRDQIANEGTVQDRANSFGLYAMRTRWVTWAPGGCGGLPSEGHQVRDDDYLGHDDQDHRMIGQTHQVGTATPAILREIRYPGVTMAKLRPIRKARNRP